MKVIYTKDCGLMHKIDCSAHCTPYVVKKEIEYQIWSSQAYYCLCSLCHIDGVKNDIILCSYAGFVLNVCLVNCFGKKCTYMAINTFWLWNLNNWSEPPPHHHHHRHHHIEWPPPPPPPPPYEVSDRHHQSSWQPYPHQTGLLNLSNIPVTFQKDLNKTSSVNSLAPEEMWKKF